MRITVAAVTAFSLSALLDAQESVRDLERPGEQLKHLTPDTVDRWKLAGKAGEILRIDVSSAEFDPVVALVGAEDHVIQGPVDDPGSTSKLLVRLAQDGKYAILVHGPDKRGGGNYRLYVERFAAVEMGADRRLVGSLDRDGVDHVRFAATDGEIVLPVDAPVVEIIDPKGDSLQCWGGSYTIGRTGEHYVRLRGERAQPYRLRVLSARQRELQSAEAAAMTDTREAFDGQGIDVWEFAGKTGEFRAVELEHELPCHLRLVCSDPGEVDDELRPRPEIDFVPVHSKGNRQRLAFLLGRTGRFQIHVLSTAQQQHRYRLRFGDPTQAVPLGSTLDGKLASGGAAFFTFDIPPMRLVQVDVRSEHFDPVLIVKRPDGSDLGHDDDGGGDLASRLSLLVTEAGPFRVQVTSYGNGGGGAYTLQVRELEIPELAIGESREAEMPGPGVRYWHFAGRREQTAFISARSATLDMSIRVHDPDGVVLGADADSGVGHDPLLALRLPADGRYTIVATNERGSGAFRIQALDPDGR